jgi:MFS family permease
MTLFGAFISPAWNSLMRDIFDKGSGKYFGRRNKIMGTVVLLVMLLSGIVLNFFKERNEVFFGWICCLFFLGINCQCLV